MSETVVLQKKPPYEESEKYFSFQIKGWTNFDPMDKALVKIAQAIEDGGGFLTLVEVMRVEDDLASIGDDEVSECFKNILAAKRLLKNVHEIPKKLIEELSSALKAEEEVVPKKPVTMAPISPVNNESGSRPSCWP